LSLKGSVRAMLVLITDTQSSVSATRQGLVEKRSRATPKPSAVDTR
jgi:hypothetical protein